MTDFTLGMDVSHHQRPIDWQRAAAAGYRYVFVRATYGSKLKDRNFAKHWEGAKAAGFLVSAYHFMRTSDPVARQIDLFLEVLGDRTPDLPLALDVERDPLADAGAPDSRRAWTEWTMACLDHLEAAGRHRSIIYTAASFWNPNLERSDRWARHDLWVAHYTDAANPRIPLDWATWRFWQFTSKGAVPGAAGNIDLNRFAGTEADLRAYAGGSAGLAAPEPRLQVRVVAPVNIRSGPSIKHDKVGMFTDRNLGTRLPVHEVGGQDAWIRFGPGRWVACEVPSGPLCRIELQADGRVLARVIARRVNVRSGPGTDFADVGDLERDDAVEVLEIGGRDAWVRWSPSQWTALQVGDRVFLAAEEGDQAVGALETDNAGGGPSLASEVTVRPMPAGRARKRPRGDEG